MVFKISKGGVRSGNTLRGLNTAKSRRYGHHACLLGCTSLGRRDLNRLISDSSDEDDDIKMVREALGKTDVLLSLNKHQRWRLPAMIGHMIKQGDFNKGAVVSLLERHNLKRRANCVKLVSNSKKWHNVTPKQKKYFSFSLDSFCDDESNRQKKKARAEEMKKLPQDKTWTRSRSMFKTVETFTSEGIPASELSLLQTSKPEYRLEVFYPCPTSCSLTYNPKYTDVIIAEGKNGQMEVKSNVKTKKKRMTKHRKRLLLKDMDQLYSEAIQEDVDDLWNIDYCENIEDDKKENDECENKLKASDTFTIDTDIIQKLIDQAQRTRELCVIKERHHRSSKRSKFQNLTKSEEKSNKIIFVNREDDQQQSHDVISTPNSDSTSIKDENNSDISSSDLVFLKVILATSEVAHEELQRVYGARYVEALCQPRRFVVDVTDDITNLFTSKTLPQNVDVSSYLVYVYDGFYDEGLALYKVALNSMLGNKLRGLADIVPFAPVSMADIMSIFAGYLLDHKEENGIHFVDKNKTQKAPMKSDFVNSRMKLKVQVIERHNMQNTMFTDRIGGLTDKEKQQIPTHYCTDLDEEYFCDVCYASVSSSRLDSVDGTRLPSCGHLLCNECWIAHCRTNIKDGKTVMSCGGYDCNTEVGEAILMSILNVSEIKLILRRQVEERLDRMENAKYCPYPECGRVIIVQSKSEDTCVDVICACGNKICFSCFGPAHWPARCDQAEEYIQKLPDLKPANEHDEGDTSKTVPPPIETFSKAPKIVTVEGRICPECSRFIYKDGGCRRVVCKCGFSMCWECVKGWHYDVCRIDMFWVFKHTRIVHVKHVTSKTIVPIDSVQDKENSIPQKNRQRTSLYQKAMLQHQEGTRSTHTKMNHMMPLVYKMVTAAREDTRFREEIAKSLKAGLPVNDEACMISNLKTFVKTLLKMKERLHHVTEYTFILLQGTPHGAVKQRMLKLADDLSGFCSFIRSILDLRENQDAKSAFRRLVNLQEWAKRALDALIVNSHSLRAD